MKYGDVEPKPPMLPPLIDARPKKLFEADKLNTQFGDVLAGNLEESSNKDPNLGKKIPSAKKQLSNTHTLLQTTQLHYGVDHLPLHLISAIEHIGQKANFEKTSDPNYINYTAALQAGLNAKSIDDIKKRKKDLQDANPTELDETSDATGLTSAHNIQSMGGIIDQNPFKKADKNNRALFNSAGFTQFLDNISKNEWGKKEWDQAKQAAKSIQEQYPVLENAPDNFSDNNIDSFDILANHNTIKTHQTKPNEYGFETWNAKTTEGYLRYRYDGNKKYFNVIRQFAGNINSQLRHILRIESQEKSIEKSNSLIDSLLTEFDNLSSSMLDAINSTENVMDNTSVVSDLKSKLEDAEELSHLIDQQKESFTKEELAELAQIKDTLTETKKTKAIQETQLNSYVQTNSLSHPKQWWENIGKHIGQNGILLQFGLLAESAQSILKHMELAAPSQSKDPFQNKLITDYTQQLNTHTLPKFVPKKTITADDLKVDNIAYGKELFKLLSDNNIITNEGHIINFDPTNKDFYLDLSEPETERVRTLLHSKFYTEHDFDNMDTKKIHNRKREDIQLIDPNGAPWALHELLSPYNQSNTQNRYEQASTQYNVLFDILESMAGTNLSQKNQLKPQLTQLENGVKASIYPKANWNQYNPEIASIDPDTNEVITQEGWESVQEQALEITFETTEKANDFFNEIHQLIKKLEPLVATFTKNPTTNTHRSHYKNGVITQTPTRILTTNEGFLDPSGIINSNHSSYKVHVDISPSSTFFKTRHWAQTSQYIKDHVIQKIGLNLFTKTQINRLNKNKHKQKNEDYKERRKEWEEKEYDRKVSEKKADAKKKAERKSLSKKMDTKRSKRQKENKAALKKAAMKRKKENTERLKEISRANKRKNDQKKAKR